jgi:hypothetical protein
MIVLTSWTLKLLTASLNLLSQTRNNDDLRMFRMMAG